MTCNKKNRAAVMFLPLIETPQDGLIAVGTEFEIEREACDHAEHLARSGFGRYGGAVAVVSDVWLADDDKEGPL